MEISEVDKERRILLAEDIANVILLFLLMIDADIKLGKTPDSQYYIESMKNRMEMILIFYDWIGIETVMGAMADIDRVIADIVEGAIEHQSALSDSEKAETIAEDLANVVGNMEQYQTALRLGYTKKTWHTMGDRFVRETHKKLDNMQIDIHEPFVSSGSKMMYPTDLSMGANLSEIINCRCSCSYEK